MFGRRRAHRVGRPRKQAMAEAEWQAAGDPTPLLEGMWKRMSRGRAVNTVPYRKPQLVGVAAVRRVARWLTPRGQAALSVAERMADEAVPADEREAAIRDIGDGSLDRPGGYRKAPESVYSADPRVEAAAGAVMMLVSPT